METGDLPAGSGLDPEAAATVVSGEQVGLNPEAVNQGGKIVIKEGFCAPWGEDPASFDPAQAGWEQAAGNVLVKIQEMLASPEVTLTPDGLTPQQAAAREQENLLTQANARAAQLAEDLAAARRNVEQTATEAPLTLVSIGAPVPAEGTEISQLVEAPTSEPGPVAATPEAGDEGLDQLLEQVPAEMKEEIEKRLAEFGGDFDEDKFAQEHPEEYEFINQVISESGDPEKAAETPGKVKAHLDMLDSQEDGDKKKKDFLVNLFGIYKHRLNQERDPKKKEEIKKSMLGLRQELAGLGIGSLEGLLEVIIGAVVGEVQEQLK